MTVESERVLLLLLFFYFFYEPFHKVCSRATVHSRLKPFEHSRDRIEPRKDAHMHILTYFIEIEGVLARYRAVKPRFQETRPSVAKCVRSALVVLTDSTDPRVHRLKCETGLVGNRPRERESVHLYVRDETYFKFLSAGRGVRCPFRYKRFGVSRRRCGLRDIPVKALDETCDTRAED